ncbi:hypothetical protein QT397_00455 (plasmid) [Microbulbifer sp. MKSA007]|nr:hypothetical protein QT397_00455 [Microbulbifer sp. MKSA007]
MFVMPATCAVSEKFKCIVEELEPDVHQFFPIQLKNKDGIPYDERYYLINVGQKFAAILVGKSAGCTQSWRVEAIERKMPFLLTHDDGLVLSKPKIAGRHLWLSQVIAPNTYFCSDELMARFKKEKIKYFDSARNDEADEDWIAEENIAPFLRWREKHPEIDMEVL